MDQVEILLGTYNGAECVKAQIRSIQLQTYSNWTLSVSDDCSTDGTLEIVQECAREDPRIHIVSSNRKFGSAQSNFTFLMEQATGFYVMFCDQDDIWHANKLEVFMDCMKDMEYRWGQDCPLMLFSDLTVVDAGDNLLAPSFLRLIGRDGHRTHLSELLVQNLVTGCACCMNNSLRECIQSLGPLDSERMLMHDWFYALVAAALGHVVYVNESTVDYRQHNTNVVGAHHYSPWKIIGKMVLQGNTYIPLHAQIQRKVVGQAEYLRELLPCTVSKESRRLITDFCSLPFVNQIKRTRLLLQDGFWPYKIADRCLLWISFLCM